MATRAIDFETVDAMDDPLTTYDFELFIPNIPGSNADVDLFRTKVLVTALPGSDVEPIEVAFHGMVRKYAGKRVYAGEISITLLELRDVSTRKVLLTWMNKMRNKSSVGTELALAKQYKTIVELALFDAAEDQVLKCIMKGAFIQSVAETGLDGSTSDVMRVDAIISYDHFDDEY